MAVVREHCGAYGQGVEYAATMAHKIPPGRRQPLSNDRPATDRPITGP